ncbi:MAG: FtsX-like permease family protein [Acidobacteriota bacterium]
MVGADHFATLGVTLLAGRELGPEDVASGAPVVVVNETLARTWWPGLDPIGRPIGKFRVVGVVADHATFAGEDRHTPMAYVHLPDAAGRWPCLLVRTEGDPGALASSLQQLARQVDPGAPILRIATLADHLDGLHHHLRVASWLLGLCGLASLALAAIGIYSLLAYGVAGRRKEIGLRMALGATRQTVAYLVVSRLMYGVVPGLALGGAGSFFLNRGFPSLFVGPAALDARALTLGAAVLLGVSLLASVAPAYHATRIEPAITLRGE